MQRLREFGVTMKEVLPLSHTHKPSPNLSLSLLTLFDTLCLPAQIDMLDETPLTADQVSGANGQQAVHPHSYRPHLALSPIGAGGVRTAVQRPPLGVPSGLARLRRGRQGVLRPRAPRVERGYAPRAGARAPCTAICGAAP